MGGVCAMITDITWVESREMNGKGKVHFVCDVQDAHAVAPYSFVRR